MSGDITRALIATATRAARAAAQKRVDEQASMLRDLLGALAAEIRDQVQRYAGADGAVDAASIPIIRDYLDGRLGAFMARYSNLLDDGLVSAAVLGSDILKYTAADAVQAQFVEQVLNIVRDFRAADGLQLSDRIWRARTDTVDQLTTLIQNGILRGDTAAKAARLAGAAADLLTKDDAPGNPRANLERVLRTEMNRAYTTAYEQSAMQHPDAAGVKFNLSPNHPKTDICDLFASANFYGLGPGVYPAGQSPYPAHPNTISFLTTVWTDQVTDEDRVGLETWQDWLAEQSPDEQDAILGGKRKGAAFRDGQLQAGDLRRPWYEIAARLGVDA